MTAEELVVAIRVTAENAEETIEAIKSSCEELGATVEKTKKAGDGAFSPMKHSAEEAAAAQAVLAGAAASAFAAIKKAVSDGTAAYNEFVAATKGLESIASGKGIAQDKLSGALEDVTDEFLSAGAAATAFKNLLSRGFSLEQAVQVIGRLKDSAAFGRAANLSLSDAVVTATEGIRQENSVLVDNAGVTKNVAKMWEDYAKARGLTTASLTQAQKVEAEYIGIMQETELQAGDLEKAADTLAGAQARSAAQSQKLAASYGGALEPAMKLAADVSGELMKGMNDLITAAPGLTSGLTTAAAAMALYVTVTKAAGAAQKLFSAASIAVNPVMMGIAAAIGVAAAGYTAYKKAQQEAAEAQKKAQEAAEAESRAQRQNALDLQEREKSLARLGQTYKELTDTQNRTESQNARLERIIGELSSQYGISEEALRGLDGQYDAGNAAIEERIRLYDEEKKKLLEKQLEEKNAALAEAQNKQTYNGMMRMQLIAFGAKPDFSKAENEFAWRAELQEYERNFIDVMPEAQGAVDQLMDSLYKAGSAEEAEAAWNAFFDGLNKNCEESAEKVDALEGEIKNLHAAIEGKEDYKAPAANGEAANIVPGAENGAKTAQETAEAYQRTLEAMVAMQEVKANIAVLESEEATLEEKRAAAIALQREGYGYLLGSAEAIAAAKAQIIQQDEAQLEAYEQQREALEAQREALEAAHDAGEIGDSDYEAKVACLNAALAQTREETLEAANGMNQLKDSADETGTAFSDMKTDATQLDQKLRRSLNFRQDIKNMKDMASQVEKTGGSWEDLSDDVKEFSRRMGIADGDLAGTIAGLAEMETQTDLSAAGMVSELQGILGELETMRAELMTIPPAEMTADASQAMGEINDLIAMINLVLSLAGQAGIDMTGQGKKSRRGGGGGGRKSRKDDEEEAAREAERAAREAERAQEEAFRNEIERIEHRRHLGEITAQEEIEELERVKREYAKTADQIMDIDERIYDARQALKEKEQDKITQLHESVVDALEARYEAQREAEQKRISESIAAWNKWADDTCAAIQKQIDALDEQEKAEDRAATEKEHLHKIEGLKEALVYEKDAYNRGQLEKQLEKAQEDWNKVQKGWEKDDKRTELEEQLKAVEEQAKQEIDALEKESERVDSVYDEMVKEQSLAAEAQKVLMQSTQDELLDLLGSYAPDYKAAGKSLGEKLYEGFQDAFGNITAWFNQIDAKFEEIAEKAQEAAFGKTSSLQAAGEHTADVSKPEIHQTVNFNQPVESPAEFTRRMQQVGEELVGMM